MGQKSHFLKFAVTLAIIVMLIFGLYLFADWFSKTTGYSIGEDEKTKLANCLSDKDVEFYCSIYSSDCAKQEDEFGRAINVISKVECGKNLKSCPNIREVPAWYINKEVYYGFKNISELKEISGC